MIRVVYYFPSDGNRAAAVPVGRREYADDVALARALQRGENDAAAAAWARFRPMVQGTLKRLLGAGDDIPDLTQDVFARFFDRIRHLRSPESLRFFVVGIAFRRAREEIRRRHAYRTQRPMMETHFRLRHRDDGVGPERGAAASALARRLEQLGQDGEIYLLRVIHGCDLPEISRVMSLSISTVRRRFNRAQQWMESRTQDPEDGDRVGGGGGPPPQPERGGVWGPSEGPHDNQISGTDTQARLAQLSSPSSAS
jgi:RNA polymerase sigma factor (sigma-70 family)